MVAARTGWRIRADDGRWSVFPERRSENGERPGPPVHDDLVQPNITATGPDQLWLTDVPPLRGRCPLRTPHERGRALPLPRRGRRLLPDRRLLHRLPVGVPPLGEKSHLALAALSTTVAGRRAMGMDVADHVVRSDRGSQPRSRRYVHAPVRYGLVDSVGRVGATGDDAAMESSFALLQEKALDRRRRLPRVVRCAAHSVLARSPATMVVTICPSPSARVTTSSPGWR
ncbi:hypothetical protein GCM10027586_05550 [Kineococcus gypseus]